MAISWGSATSTTSTGNAMRLGHEWFMSPSSVGPSTTSVQVTLRQWVGTRGTVNDSNNRFVSTGSFTSDRSVSIDHRSTSPWSSSNITQVMSSTRTVTLTDSAQTLTFSSSFTGINAIPGTARHSGSFTVPRRAVKVPAAVSGLHAVRVSDVQHGVRWTGTATSTAPVETYRIQRQDNVNTGFITLSAKAGSGGGDKAFTDRTTTAGRRYRWRVRAENSAGASAWVYTDYVHTTPTAPTVPVSSRSSTGIRTVWTNRAAPGVQHEIGWGDSFAMVGSATLTAGIQAYTHTNPDPLVPWRYRVRAVATGPAGQVLESGWTAWSNTVLLAAAPATPTDLEPADGLADATEPVLLAFEHTSVDGSSIEAYQLLWRRQGDTTWTDTGKVAQTYGEHEVPADTWTNGNTYEWQVRTWGAHPDPSPYSQIAVVSTAERPIPSIYNPDGLVITSRVRVQWIGTMPEGTTQTGYELVLRDADGNVLEERGGDGTGGTADLNRHLEDGATYTVALRIRASNGMWSHPVEATFDVAYAPPPVANLEAEWDVETGSVTVSITHPAATSTQAEAVDCELWRLAPGEDWVCLATDLPLETVLVDAIPGVNGVNYYEVRTASVVDSQSTTGPVAVDCPVTGWVYINAGPGWSHLMRVHNGTSVDGDGGRSKTLVQLETGQNTPAYPTEIVGNQHWEEINLRWRYAEGSNRSEVQAISRMPGPHMYRDCTGNRMFCSMSNTPWQAESVLMFGQAKFTRVQHAE